MPKVGWEAPHKKQFPQGLSPLVSIIRQREEGLEESDGKLVEKRSDEVLVAMGIRVM